MKTISFYPSTSNNESSLLFSKKKTYLTPCLTNAKIAQFKLQLESGFIPNRQGLDWNGLSNSLNNLNNKIQMDQNNANQIYRQNSIQYNLNNPPVNPDY